jgi:anaerobic dimethyl sulfoxide reductase subunit A
LGECISVLDIAGELAERLGIENFNPFTEDDILRMFVEQNPETAKLITDFDKFRREGIHRVALEKPIVAFQKQIEDLENHPFETPSGKIEIFSQRVADLNNPLCPPIPKYMKVSEDRSDPLVEKYPLQLLTPHPKNRVHSELYKVDWLREVEEHRAWINPLDAAARGIADDDKIYVYNDRGRVMIPAWVTERIKPGVISIFEGAWYAPDEKGIDQGACANTLTRDAYSGGGAAVLNTSLVQVEKA